MVVSKREWGHSEFSIGPLRKVVWIGHKGSTLGCKDFERTGEMNHQTCQPTANKTATSEHLKVMENSLLNYVLYNERERKEEAHHGSNTVRSPALYVPDRTW
jgi:hypothetical protein